jgi:xanthine dehydrogenase accessory factor
MDTQWPLFGWIDDVRPALAAAAGRGEAVALATIRGVSSSSPRPPGSQMLFVGDEAAGYFSGGCVESDVAIHARASLDDGEPRLLRYGVGSPWIDIRLVCGGSMEILVERLDPAEPAVQRLLDGWHQRTPLLYKSDGRSRSVSEAGGDLPFAAAGDGGFQKRYDPQRRLIVVGSDPTALAIAQLGSQAGMETALVRPNGPGGCPLTGVRYLRTQVDEALASFRPDRWTAVAVATHDTEQDHAGLVAALVSDAYYVGVLGARSRLEERKALLRKDGFDAEQIARLRAPIGIAGCGKAPWEIAVSVVAEILIASGAR